MCELLIRIVDKPGLIPVRSDHTVTKAGDVIAVCPNGQGWGRKEVLCEEYRVWCLPEVRVEKLIDMEETERSVIGGKSFFIRTRVRYLDLNSATAREWISRGQKLIMTRAESALVMSWRRTKQALGRIG